MTPTAREGPGCGGSTPRADVAVLVFGSCGDFKGSHPANLVLWSYRQNRRPPTQGPSLDRTPAANRTTSRSRLRKPEGKQGKRSFGADCRHAPSPSGLGKFRKDTLRISAATLPSRSCVEEPEMRTFTSFDGVQIACHDQDEGPARSFSCTDRESMGQASLENSTGLFPCCRNDKSCFEKFLEGRLRFPILLCGRQAKRGRKSAQNATATASIWEPWDLS
jgi:hypothetical protein